MTETASGRGQPTRQDYRPAGEGSPIKGPRWPSVLCELVPRLRAAPGAPAPERTCREVWQLLSSCIGYYLRLHSRRMGGISDEDRQDIAAEKSLDLLRRIVQGTWDISGRSPAEIAAFVSTVARNGLLDRLRESRRWVPMQDVGQPERGEALMSETSAAAAADSPDLMVERKEFAASLRRCAEGLNPRARLIWFFRVFYSMSSKEIAAHPEINLKASHVDVLLQRTRDALRECMQQQGYEPRDMPPGTFVELWKAFRLPEASHAMEPARG